MLIKFVGVDYFYLFYPALNCLESFDISGKQEDMKRGAIIIALLNFMTSNSYSQHDSQFSQYMFNLAAINPGYVGSSDMICLSAINRQQWLGFPGAPNYSFVNANAAVKPLGIKSGVGLSILSDNIAFDKDLSISGAYAYRYDLGEGTLGIGVNLGVYNTRLETAEWEYPLDIEGSIDPNNDQAVPNSDESRLSFDMAFGLFYKTDKLYFGLSSNHINRPKIKYVDKDQSYIGRHYYAVAGYNIQLPNPMIEVLPSVFLKTDGRGNQFDASTLVRYNKKFWAGVSFRPGDALTGMVGFELFNGVKVGYSYDFTTSDIGNYSNGSHEFTLGYCFSLSLDKSPQKYKSIRFL